MYTQLQLRDSARPPVNVATLRRMKEQGEKIASLTWVALPMSLASSS